MHWCSRRKVTLPSTENGLVAYPSQAVAKPTSSPTWKRMFHVKDSVAAKSLVLVREGNSSFWYDHWQETDVLHFNESPAANSRINQLRELWSNIEMKGKSSKKIVCIIFSSSKSSFEEKPCIGLPKSVCQASPSRIHGLKSQRMMKLRKKPVYKNSSSSESSFEEKPWKTISSPSGNLVQVGVRV
ncbi:hypothetical protein ACH5RR_000590 [Cinchona calisaya]|uniref:Uncharacterized protein n=1 Tax=Cinchona calisaya TaxID=153742 RepID=A0ABD3B140_9GENT